MTEELSRTSALASRHKELGSGLEDWNGMGTAWSYSSDPNTEHDAIRERVGMFDMSPLKKVMISGSDAVAVLNHLTTREISNIDVGHASYLSVLTEQGTMADDAIVYNNGNDEWMIVHGSGDTMSLLGESAKGKSVQISFTDSLHNVSVQGPDSLSVLNENCSYNLAELAYFQHCDTTLFTHPCRISRTGYSGERGYEVFVDEKYVGDVWDKLIDAGVMPCSFASLDKVRIEAGLLFYGYDMTTAHTPYEVGLGFTVTKSKSGYRGADALAAAKGQEKILNVCLEIEHSDMVNGEEIISINGKTVGVVNSPCYSHRLGKSLSLAHVKPEFAKPGTRVHINGGDIDCDATVVAMPVYDPDKLLTHQN